MIDSLFIYAILNPILTIVWVLGAVLIYNLIQWYREGA